MLNDYTCPLCGSDDWQTVRTYKYHVSDHTKKPWTGNDRVINLRHFISNFVRVFRYACPKPDVIHERLLNTYERRLRDVFITHWNHGRQETTITSQYCRTCGFMGYRPRPDDDEIGLKYQLLNKNDSIDDMERYNARLDADSYARKSRDDLHKLVTGAIGDKRIRILDCGGASGWYIAPFVKGGHTCELVDYLTGQLPGIQKIADDVTELEERGVYDAIVCRAVLEHLTDPLSTVTLFHELLNVDGVVYAMVPCEIFAGISRLGYDPATHINFFTPQSFATLFMRAGFEVIDSGADEMSNIWILARKKQQTDDTTTIAPVDIERYLYPKRGDVVKKYLFGRIRLALMK